FWALRWIGMWMALRTKRHHRAILATLARVMLIPWLAILITFFLGMGGRGFSTRAVTTLTTFWLLLGLATDITLARRATFKLRRAFRERPLPVKVPIGSPPLTAAPPVIGARPIV